MAMQSGADIRALIASGTVSIERCPGDTGDEFRGDLVPHITNVGIDITLGAFRCPYDLTARRFLPFKISSQNRRYLLIPARHTVSVETHERLTLSGNIAALVESKVRMVSQGISHISTTIDPLWSGTLLLTFVNNTARPIRIDVGEHIATVVFFVVATPVSSPGDAAIANNDARWVTYSLDAAEAKKERRLTLIAVSLLFAALVIWLLWTLLGGSDGFFSIRDSVLSFWNEDKGASRFEKWSWVGGISSILVILFSLVVALYKFVRFLTAKHNPGTIPHNSASS